MPESDLAKRTVLVVDDYDDNRLMLKKILQKRGFIVIEAVNGEEAIATAQRDHPDLILMDINLPLLDGFIATRYIRQQQELVDIPIVAITAYGNKKSRDVALAAGCNEYLEKPIDFAQIDLLLERFLPKDQTPAPAPSNHGTSEH
ncbi:MAG: response regulator [Acidobacteriota bacterium]|nr:response regulator [Acidobacteriota bacterium]